MKNTDWGRWQWGWCGHGGSKTSWADIDGDGNADMICDDNVGRHWARLMNGNRGVKRDLGHMVPMHGWCRHAGSYVQFADINGDGKDDYICDDTHG